MELYQMRYFAALVAHGQFAKAAEALYIMPPTLTIAIKKLEAELGTPLIDRTKQRFSLTSAGRDFYKYCSQILDAVDDLEVSMHNIRDSRSAVTLLMDHSLNCRAMNDHLEQFLETNPDIDVWIKWQDSATIKWSLLEKEDFLGVMPETDDLPRLQSTHYCTCDISAFFHRDHPWAELETISLDALREANGEILNLYDSPLCDKLAELGINKNGSRLVITTNDMIKTSIKNRFGVALMPSEVGDGEDSICSRLLSPPLYLDYIFVYYSASPVTPAMKKLMGFLQKYAR